MKIIFATGNQGKLREVRAIVADLGIEVESMKDAGIDYIYQTVYELTYSCLIRLLGVEQNA